MIRRRNEEISIPGREKHPNSRKSRLKRVKCKCAKQKRASFVCVRYINPTVDKITYKIYIDDALRNFDFASCRYKEDQCFIETATYIEQ